MLRKGLIKAIALVSSISSVSSGARFHHYKEGAGSKFDPAPFLQLITRKLTGYFSNCLSMISSKTLVQKA